MLRIFPLLAKWAWLELTEGWRSWFETAADVEASRPVFNQKRATQASPAAARVEQLSSPPPQT
jgi:hypothetical protein